MKITLTPKNTTALVFLSFIMQETHELAHTVVGRMICGCWGKRNFNVWTLCKGCSDEKPWYILATYAGPAYSFTVIWLGLYLLLKSSAKVKSIGFALIVSSMPFSRVLTPIIGGGDEVYALNSYWNNHTLAWIVAVVIVLTLAIPPVVKIWTIIENRRKNLWIVGIIFGPFIATGVFVFGILQTLLLGNGILKTYWILGSPMLITLWFILCLIVCAILGNSLTTLLQPSETNAERTRNVNLIH
ncbi:hypothetical protein L6Q79_08220 [bacterium]|nr:hypothetical protein [bacterium]NUN45598.1 hypothetical protein [bacterium]